MCSYPHYTYIENKDFQMIVRFCVVFNALMIICFVDKLSAEQLKV